MKFLIKKIYITFLTLNLLFINQNVLGKENKLEYSKEDVSNYFSGKLSTNLKYNNNAYNYFKKVKSIKNKHTQFNIEYLNTLVLLSKFDKAFEYSSSIWKEDEILFEADLMIGLKYLIKGDYLNAEKYFKRLNQASNESSYSDNFIGNVLLAWNSAYQGKKNDSFSFINKIPSSYNRLGNIQNIFLKCFFGEKEVDVLYKKLISNKKYNFSRYNFFLMNYLLSNNKIKEAEILVKKRKKNYNTNLLIKQTDNFFLNQKNSKIVDFYNCKDPKDSLAELFYIIANLYSSEQDYQTSNFYMKISLLLNDKFLTNKALLAENYFYQQKNEMAIDIYRFLKTIGPIYSWHSAKSITSILFNTNNKEDAIKKLKKEFKKISNKNYEHYYEFANINKDYENYEESVMYYSIALKKIDKSNFLIPKILYRRGTSYERLGNWENAEIDLKESLKILPEQPHVLNYLAYSWIDKKINLDEGLAMLKKAINLKDNDGYIIDSVGWAYYAKKDYMEAKRFLEQAVQLMPEDPTINDHYADTLWMLNKKIQARYFWNYILGLKKIEEKMRENINNKIAFGIKKNT